MNQVQRRNQTSYLEAKALLKNYNHDLQIYKIPPCGKISFNDFKELASERQRVLELVNLTYIRNPDLKNIDELKKVFSNALKKENLASYEKLLYSPGCSLEPDLKIRHKDHVSHFLLRLSYCQQEENFVNFFIDQEVKLFKFRYTSLNNEGILKFLEISGFNYLPITEQEKEENKKYLFASTKADIVFDKINFYKMPFHKVVDLISDRAVFVHNGYAFVPQNELVFYFADYFRQHLIVELEKTKLTVLRNFHDSRTQNFLRTLPKSFENLKNNLWENKTVSLSEIYELSNVSFPLCMRIMHENLLKQHKLKYQGRIQYTLFLKGINVSLKDGLQFWENEFTKHPEINEEVFRKRYAYHFRYSYGKEGKRKNFKPKDCKKLIETQVGPNEVHGCPFVHMDKEELKKKLSEFKIHSSDAEEILRFSKEGFFTLACLKYFRSSHENQFPIIPISSPNEYFNESLRIHNRKLAAVDKENTSDNLQDSPENSVIVEEPLNKSLEMEINVDDKKSDSNESVEVITLEDTEIQIINNIEVVTLDDSE